MREFPALVFLGLTVGIFVFPMETHAQDGQACLAAIKRGNDLNAQIIAVRKKAEQEDECNAETKFWSQAANLLDHQISLEHQTKVICAGFTVTGGVTTEELTTRAQHMRKFEAAAKDGCDPPPPPKRAAVARPDPGAGLVVSGTISCFGGGTCKSPSKAQPSIVNRSPQKVPPKGRQPTITGSQFNDKAPPDTGTGLVAPAK